MTETDWLLKDWFEVAGQITVVIVLILLIPKLMERAMAESRKPPMVVRHPRKRSGTRKAPELQ